MSFFTEIQGLFKTEITNSPQYQVAVKIKDLIIDDIITPSIDFIFSYKLQAEDYVNFENQEKEEQIIAFALKMILGFEVEITNGQVIVIMNKFLA